MLSHLKKGINTKLMKRLDFFLSLFIIIIFFFTLFKSLFSQIKCMQSKPVRECLSLLRYKSDSFKHGGFGVCFCSIFLFTAFYEHMRM